MATAMPRIPITKAMIDDTLREVLNNQMSDCKIAEKCLGDPSHTKVVSDIRRSHGFRKDRQTGKLVRFETQRVADLGKQFDATARPIITPSILAAHTACDCNKWGRSFS
jgi:hypothetical protein